MSKLIYFMRPVGHIGPIKIGCSRMPQERLEALSIVSPLKLEIVATAPGAHADERRLHGMFQAHWLHHEWFGASKELLALVDYVATHGALPELPEVVAFRRPCKHVARRSIQRHEPRAATIAFAQKVAPLYAAGQSTAEIAAAEGVCVSTIYKALRFVGVERRRCGPTNPTRGVADAQRAEEFSRRYLAGETLKAIGDDYGISRERVRQVLRKTDVPTLGHRKEHCKHARALTEDEIAAARMYETGTRPKAVQAAFPGLTIARLHWILRRLDIPRREAGHWLKRPDQAERAEAVAVFYRQGLRAPEIVERLPWLKHPETVYYYLKKAGVEARCDTGWGKRWKHRRAAGQIAMAT